MTSLFDDLERLKSEGPSNDMLSAAKTTLIQEYRTNIGRNVYLRDQIAFRYQSGEPVDSIFSMEELYANLTPADIQAAARKYPFDPNNYIKITLVPERKRP